MRPESKTRLSTHCETVPKDTSKPMPTANLVPMPKCTQGLPAPRLEATYRSIFENTGTATIIVRLCPV